MTFGLRREGEKDNRPTIRIQFQRLLATHRAASRYLCHDDAVIPIGILSFSSKEKC